MGNHQLRGGDEFLGCPNSAPTYARLTDTVRNDLWPLLLRCEGEAEELAWRAVEPPLLAVGDGALGLWTALDRVFPATCYLTSAAGTIGP